MKCRKNKAAKGPHKHDHLDVSQLLPSVQTTKQDPFTEYISQDNTESTEDSEDDTKSIEDSEDCTRHYCTVHHKIVNNQ